MKVVPRIVHTQNLMRAYIKLPRLAMLSDAPLAVTGRAEDTVPYATSLVTSVIFRAVGHHPAIPQGPEESLSSQRGMFFVQRWCKFEPVLHGQHVEER